MQLNELYLDFIVQLQSIYSHDEAAVITDMVVEKIAGTSRADILKQGSQSLKPATLQPLNNALEQLLRHRPVQYVIGEAWFYKLKFTVNENVLIPRPETEELAEWLIKDAKQQQKNISIIDIGTGSGCIPIAINKNLPATTITAIDLEETALEVAQTNAIQHNAAVSFLQMNFLDETAWNSVGKFDIIVSNPPYIPLTGKNEMDKNVVDHEPHTALFVPDEDPLIFYRKILLFAKTHLHTGGKIYMETHGDLAKKVAAIFSNNCHEVEIKKDISGKERMVKAVLIC